MLGIKSYQTIWTMSRKIRKSMAKRDAKYKLAGIIEMGEAYFGGATGKPGTGAQGKAIVEVCVEDRGNKPG